VAKICLSGDSVMGRLKIGREEVTRDTSCDISPMQGLLKMQDPNLLVTFEEGDREGLDNLSEKMLVMAESILKLSDTPSGTDLSALLLPKKTIKSAAKRAAKKVKEMVVSEESSEEPAEEEDSE
jgi:hypothetical protein